MHKDEKGFSTIEFLIGAVLITFVILFPIVVQMKMHTIHSLEQELDRTLQMASVEGGITSNIEKITKKNLEERGIKFIKYTDETTKGSLPKGETIHVGIVAEQTNNSMFSGVMGLIGGDDGEVDTFTVEGNIMSEYIP